MSETGSPNELPQAVAKGREGGRRRISSVWIIPIVAGIIGAGLAYRAYQERGVDIQIRFETAEGLTAGKTTVRFRDVDMGTVSAIHVTEDMSHVVVTASLNRASRPHLGEGSQFWVVRPRISGAGVSGLGTLLSGDYINMEGTPSKGRPQTKFVGLEEPPIDPEGGGLEVVLTSDQLHGLGEGSGVFYRGISVGAVDRYELDKDGAGVLVHVTVEKKYAELVHENSRFYNASGIDITASLSQGFEFDMESLRTLIAGGVELDTPGKPGPAAKNGARFELRRHPHAAGKGGHAPPSGPRFVLEAPTLGSVKTGDAVLYREEQVGQVVSHALHDDGRSVGILVAIESRYAPLVRANTIFWNASGISADLGLTGLHVHTESLESLLEGGIAFATPSKPGTRAAAGSVFELQDKGPKDWVKWAPRVALGSRGGGKAPAEPEEKIHHDEEAKADPESHHWFHHLFH